MRRLRIHIILLLLWLAVFYNIERLDINGYDTINLESSVYLVGVLAVLLPLLPLFQRRHVLVSVAPTLAVLLVALLLDPGPEIGGMHTYITLAEVVMVTVIVVLAHRVAGSLLEFYEAVEVVTLSDKDGRRPHTLTNAHDAVQVEMSSSRRTQRPLSLVLLQADGTSLNMMMHRFVQELQRSMMQRYVLAMMARMLSRSLRRSDLVIEDQHPGRLVLVAPETSEEAAQALGWRLKRLVAQRLGVTATFAVATFPHQALTFEELLNVAEKRLHEQRPSGHEGHDPEQEVITLAEQSTGAGGGA